MPLLADYAITPDVFDVTSYPSDEVGLLRLREIGNVMRSDGLVRDLRAGAWRALLAGDQRPWHRRGKELLKKLYTQGRLISFAPELADTPVHDQDWCEEALATHARVKLTGGVIVTQPVKDAYRSEALVASINRLDSATWWRERSSSVRLERSIAAYQQHLDLILRCALPRGRAWDRRNGMMSSESSMRPANVTRYMGSSRSRSRSAERSITPAPRQRVPSAPP